MSKLIFSYTIAVTNSSISSNDANFVDIIDSRDIDFDLEKSISNGVIFSAKFPHIENHKIENVDWWGNYIYIYFERNKHLVREFCVGFFGDIAKEPLFIQEVKHQLSLGWKQKIAEIDEINNQRWLEEERISTAKLESEGRVLWFDAIWIDKELRKQFSQKDYQGGFSDELFEVLKSYVGEGHCYGYVGHIGRTIQSDVAIEEELKKLGLTHLQMSYWITSSDGRHFMDYIESNSAEFQVEFIKTNINRIYNRCLIYGHKAHKGTKFSTDEIELELKALGKLLPEKEIEYDEGLNAMMNMIANTIKSEMIEKKIDGKAKEN